MVVKNKKCNICGEIKPLTHEFFNSRKTSSDGFRADCRSCRNKKRAKRYKEKREQILKYKREWIKKNIKTKTIKKKPPNLKPSKTKPTIVNLFGLKKCSKCGVEKQNTAEFFHKNKTSTDGLHRWCKDCANKNRKKTERRNVKITDRIYKDLSVYEDLREHPQKTGIAQCMCAYCGRWIEFTYKTATSRLASIHNISNGECRIYCDGDQCRQACPTYGQHFYPKGFKKNSSREVNTFIRHMCMQRDKYTCQKCGATGNGVILHAHHILNYAKNKIMANDIENVITLCKECHNRIHTMDGCGYRELRCE